MMVAHKKREAVSAEDFIRETEGAKVLARKFVLMSDEDQAEFFIECARLASQWPKDQAGQWFLVGRHLVTCECGTPLARQMIKALDSGVSLYEPYNDQGADRSV